MDIEKTIQSALEYCQSGELEKAEEIFLKILEDEPGHVRILNMLGVIYAQRGDYDSAIRYFEKAFSLDSGNVHICNNLGNALCENGQLDDALTYFQKAIELKPDFTDAYCDAANAFQKKGQLDEAIAYLQKAIQLNPDLYEAHFNLGLIFGGKGEIEEAIGNYEKALQINPNLPEAHYNLGNTLKERGQLDDAITHYQKALELCPDFTGALNNLGLALQDKGEPDEAATYFQRAIQIDPALASAYNNLGNVYKDKREFDVAIGWYEKAIELKPDWADSFNSLGTAFKEKGQFDEAIENFYKAIKLNPGFAEAYYNLGNAFRDKGQLDAAIDQYRKAIDLNPDYVEAHGNMTGALLAAGNLELGWEEYEWRWKRKDFAPHRDVALPFWNGASLNGKSLLIYAEQGVGDEIMFASCFGDVIKRAKSCTVECDKRLLPLFVRSFPKARFVGRDITGDAFSSYLQSIDFQIPAGSLPKYFRPNFAAFPERRSYLVPDEQQVSLWRGRYQELGEGPKIGISWRGGSKPSVRLSRSTVLEQWKGIFSVAGAHFVNLQYGGCANELQNAKEKLGVTIFDWEDADPLNDLDNFAAQTAALDLVISVDNATVHMAGALGVSTWVLLPFVGDWRWMREFEDTPWYETLRLFRQSKAGDWEGVFEKVTSGLLQFAQKGVMPDIKYSYKEKIPGP